MKSHRGASLAMLLAFSLLLLVSPAYADSDGCYCTSRGYIAFEIRPFHTPGLHAAHTLKVVRFESGRGIYEAGEAPMKDFQVHKMTCAADRVELVGFDKVWLTYVIDIRQPGKLRIIEHVEEPAQQHPLSTVGPAPGSLGLSQPGVIALGSADPEHKYQLVLSRSEKSVKDGLETTRKAEILQIDSRGNVSQRVFLYEDRNTEVPD